MAEANSETINKSLAELNKKIEDMKKSESIVNGAVDEMVQQFQPKSGSGTSGSVPKDEYGDANGVSDGVKVQEKKVMNQRAGSGAGVGEEYLGQGKEGKNVNNAAFGTKEVMTKAKAHGKMPQKPKKNVKGSKGGIPNNKTAKVPAPKGKVESNKQTSHKAK